MPKYLWTSFMDGSLLDYMPFSGLSAVSASPAHPCQDTSQKFLQQIYVPRSFHGHLRGDETPFLP